MKAQILHEGSAVVTVKWWRHRGQRWRLSTCSTEPRAEKMYLTGCCVKKSDWMWVLGVWNSALGIATDFFIYPHKYFVEHTSFFTTSVFFIHIYISEPKQIFEALWLPYLSNVADHSCFDTTVVFRVLRDKGKAKEKLTYKSIASH